MVSRIDYLSRDYDGLRTSLLQYAAQEFPDWQPSSEGDLGMVLVELFAYMGDIMSYYTDRAQFENYLSTATQRDSLVGIAHLLGYTPNSGGPAKGTVTLQTAPNSVAQTVPAGTRVQTARVPALDAPVVFETDVAVSLSAGGATSTSVAITEGVTESFEDHGVSTGLPAQSIPLRSGVYHDSVRLYVEDATGTTIINPGSPSAVTVREWMKYPHLLDAGPTDAGFEVQSTSSTTFVNLGDGINGLIPGTGLRLYVTYRHGVGAAGNLPIGSVRQVPDLAEVRVQRDSGTGVYTSSATTGGADPESVESIRYNAPRVYKTQNRAVTATDFRDLALGVSGVRKANVLTGSFSSITAYITGPDGGTPTTALRETVKTALALKALTGVSVSVSSPSFVPIDFGSVGSPITVTVGPTYSNAAVSANVDRVIRNWVSDLAFGKALTVAELYQRTMEVEGVVSAFIPVITRTDIAQTGVTTITPRAWELFTVNSINLTVTGGVA